MDIVKVNNHAGIPKYKQIVDSIEDAILKGQLKKGDQLPSLNKVKVTHEVSRDTVLMAFNELKNRGIIDSVVGKGYYIASENITVTYKTLLLFDELNAFKEDLYNTIIDHLSDNIKVDVFFHHFNSKVFHQIINENIGKYNYYVIMPANLNDINSTMSLIPKDKVYILDQMHDDHKNYPAVYQDFENDVMIGMSKIKNKLLKYNGLKIIFNINKQPKGILNGFIKFNKYHGIRYEIIEELKEEDPLKGIAYLVLEDRHLIHFIKKMKEKNYDFIKDVGLISYNESLLKQVIGDGITTISTDFKHMGKQLAEMINGDMKGQIANINHVKIRKSL